MIIGSICSGIGAAECAWHPFGWRNAFFSEIEAFPRAVLEQRFSGVPIHEDFTTIKAGQYEPIDLLVGGTPCQSFSVAGLRRGMADERGNLAYEFLRLAFRLRPRWIIWENVPGVLSCNGGRDFGAFLGGLVKCGYGFAYRVLDAQYFGVPQRRRRVFVVGYLGDWRRAAAVLFERESLRGDPPPRREAGQVAPTLPSRRTAGGGLGTDFDCDGGLIARCITTGEGKRLDAESCTFVAYGGRAVRRLTPRECERLQGFPDDWTLVPYRGKPAADAPRYKALGNSIAVPVMRWIGERIAMCERAVASCAA